MTITFNKRECSRCNCTNWEWINDDGAMEVYRCYECKHYERVIRTNTGRVYI